MASGRASSRSATRILRASGRRGEEAIESQTCPRSRGSRSPADPDANRDPGSLLHPAGSRSLSKGPSFAAFPCRGNPQGEPLVGPRYWFEPAIRRAKIRAFSWHCLRHTFASRLVMAGVDLRTVQELMGHKSIQMTVRYSHLTPKHTLAAVELLSGAVSETSTDTKTSTGTPTEARAEELFVR